MSEENKAIVSRFLDQLWNKQNLAIRDELTATGYPSAVAADAMRTAFPDLEITIEDQIAEGDKVENEPMPDNFWPRAAKESI